MEFKFVEVYPEREKDFKYLRHEFNFFEALDSFLFSSFVKTQKNHSRVEALEKMKSHVRDKTGQQQQKKDTHLKKLFKHGCT